MIRKISAIAAAALISGCSSVGVTENAPWWIVKAADPMTGKKIVALIRPCKLHSPCEKLGVIEATPIDPFVAIRPTSICAGGESRTDFEAFFSAIEYKVDDGPVVLLQATPDGIISSTATSGLHYYPLAVHDAGNCGPEGLAMVNAMMGGRHIMLRPVFGDGTRGPTVDTNIPPDLASKITEARNWISQ